MNRQYSTFLLHTPHCDQPKHLMKLKPFVHMSPNGFKSRTSPLIMSVTGSLQLIL
jgi:hypothetical protein